MSSPMTNKQELREAAEKAGAEVWCAFIDTKSKTYAVHTPDDDRCGDVVKWPGLDGQQRAAAKARFIAAANPATVLALLNELEAKDKRIAELKILAFSPAILDVISERQRQRAVEGWTSEHDDAYQNSELADAAACYALHAHNQGFSTPAHWPWSPDWWKQSGARRDLVKAGALILAEIERLDRAAGLINGEG